MLHKPGVTQNLAQFVVNARWEDPPESIRHQAKRSLLNFFAVTIAGCRTDPVDLALKSLLEFTGGRQATVVGRSERLDALSAAFLNGASANVHDYCDTHARTALHGTAPLAPGLLALSELRPVSGPDLLLAFALGFEVECRIGNAISPGIMCRDGISPRVAGFSERRREPAGSSASIAGNDLGSGYCFHAILRVVRMPRLARQERRRRQLGSQRVVGRPAGGPRISGASEPIAGVQGFFHAMGQAPNWSALIDGLGESWELAENSFKPYPGGFVIHPFLDAVLDWRRTTLARRWTGSCCTRTLWLFCAPTGPTSSTARKIPVDVQHVVAAALVFGRAGVEFSEAAVRDPTVLDVRRRIEVVRDENISVISARIELWTRDGTKASCSVPAARGSAPNPMSDQDLEEKLRINVAGWEAGQRSSR